MNVRQRGCLTLLIILAVAVACALLPFAILPGMGIGVALPVITVPGEVVVSNFLPGFNLTNTFIGTILTDVILLIFVVWAWRASRGWTREVPNRFQGLVESLVGGFYNFCRNIAGDRLRTAPFLWPLVATLFLFLLAANWMKLLPGVETIGTFHCSYAGFNGYYGHEGWTDGSWRLHVFEPLVAGYPQTDETYEDCNAWFKDARHDPYSTTATAEEIEADIAEAQAALDEAQAELSAAEENLAALLAIPEDERDGEDEDAIEEAEHAVEEAEAHVHEAEIVLERQEIRLANAASLAEIGPRIASVEAELAALRGEDEGEAEAESEGEAPDEAESTEAEATIEVEPATAEPSAGEAGEATEEATEEATAAASSPKALAASEPAETSESAEEAEAREARIDALETELTALEDQREVALTQVAYPGATLTLTEGQIEDGVIPYIFHITPFVRGAATDLSLTFALAIMSIVLVQVYGVWAQGPAYFEKFVNITALGNLGKKPLGAIDFVVGLIEIISEIGKIISLAFRLFGNLFAGGVALMAISFLAAFLVPGVILSLEIIIGAVQALVFAVLTLVFAAQAMESHHGDDHGGDHHDDEHH
jgi:F0F1-type ATP synthase membrane subunit a